MKLLNFTIIKLTACLIIGILISYFFPSSLKLSLLLSLCLFCGLLISYAISKTQFIKTIWFGMLAYLCMVSIGTLTVNIHNQKNALNHYSHSISLEKDSIKTITFRVREVLKPNAYYDKYIIDILKIDSFSVSGKSLLNIPKDTLLHTLKVDDAFICRTVLKEVTSPLNPHQFDYKEFLKKRYIYHQLFIKKPSLFKINFKRHSLLGWADGIRNHIHSKLKLSPLKQAELAIINALLLGQRQDISDEVYSSYANAGAIHILAVSGLHVGIILFILMAILKPLDTFKYGRPIKTFILVCLLWGFALIAGLSASVTRAVTMFSILAIALNLKRPTNIYNTLAISAFILLLVKPMFLFDVGFQLSYLAVLSIATIDPQLYKLWTPKNKVLNFYWHTLTVTLSAQFGIMPLSLYYFHKLPGLFFVSNLVIIPFLGIILGFGILVILLALLNLLPDFLAKTYGFIINLMNDFVGWISQQKQFLFTNIPFDLLYLSVSYIFIIALINLWYRKTYKSLRLLLLSIIMIQIAVIYTKYNLPKKEFIIFHMSKSTLLGNTTTPSITISEDLDSTPNVNDKIITDYIVGNHIKSVQRDTVKTFYTLGNKTLLVIDSLAIYNIKSVHPDYVLLRQSPKINLNRLIDSISSIYIIADGSNYKSYIENWERICKKRKHPFHQTGKKGAFIIDY